MKRRKEGGGKGRRREEEKGGWSEMRERERRGMRVYCHPLSCQPQLSPD